LYVSAQRFIVLQKHLPYSKSDRHKGIQRGITAMNRISLRLPVEQAKAVKALARAMGVPVSQVIRTAVAQYIERCRLDREDQRRQRRVRERDWEVFELLED
jgi:hypothetical protein